MADASHSERLVRERQFKAVSQTFLNIKYDLYKDKEYGMSYE